MPRLALLLLLGSLALAGARADEPPAKPTGAFAGRFSGEAKKKLIEEGGGSAASERAVALGLAWLARQQKQDGGWEFDGTAKQYRVAATGLALLAFLGTGEAHRGVGDRQPKYKETVKRGLVFLLKSMPTTGAKAGELSRNMYEQGIGTLALCEAYGMTKDPALKKAAQAATDHVQKAQGPNGSWGYVAGQSGDTSSTGWQVQALTAARLSRDLAVNDAVIKKAVKFLDAVAVGPRKAMYGYSDSKGAAAGTSLTAVGLLCRYYIDLWGPGHPGMIEGVAGLMKHPPEGKGPLKSLYYYYYATQLVHFYGGEDWKSWNEGPKDEKGNRKGGMRDWLVGLQVRKGAEANIGSWDPEFGWFGANSCGRLGTTAVCVLSLEVYYRHPLLYKRGANIAPKIPDEK
jgi:hypothetical protein